MDIKVTGITSRDPERRRSSRRKRRPPAHPRQDGEDASPTPRGDMSTYAPRIITIKIPTDKIRDVIGPGGKMIRSIIEQTGVKIDVEDDGTRQRRVGRRRVGGRRRSTSSRS